MALKSIIQAIKSKDENNQKQYNFENFIKRHTE